MQGWLAAGAFLLLLCPAGASRGEKNPRGSKKPQHDRGGTRASQTAASARELTDMSDLAEKWLEEVLKETNMILNKEEDNSLLYNQEFDESLNSLDSRPGAQDMFGQRKVEKPTSLQILDTRQSAQPKDAGRQAQQVQKQTDSTRQTSVRAAGNEREGRDRLQAASSNVQQNITSKSDFESICPDAMYLIMKDWHGLQYLVFANGLDVDTVLQAMAGYRNVKNMCPFVAYKLERGDAIKTESIARFFAITGGALLGPFPFVYKPQTSAKTKSAKVPKDNAAATSTAKPRQNVTADTGADKAARGAVASETFGIPASRVAKLSTVPLDRAFDIRDLSSGISNVSTEEKRRDREVDDGQVLPALLAAMERFLNPTDEPATVENAGATTIGAKLVQSHIADILSQDSPAAADYGDIDSDASDNDGWLEYTFGDLAAHQNTDVQLSYLSAFIADAGNNPSHPEAGQKRVVGSQANTAHHKRGRLNEAAMSYAEIVDQHARIADGLVDTHFAVDPTTARIDLIYKSKEEFGDHSMYRDATINGKYKRTHMRVGTDGRIEEMVTAPEVQPRLATALDDNGVVDALVQILFYVPTLARDIVAMAAVLPRAADRLMREYAQTPKRTLLPLPALALTFMRMQEALDQKKHVVDTGSLVPCALRETCAVATEHQFYRRIMYLRFGIDWYAREICDADAHDPTGWLASAIEGDDVSPEEALEQANYQFVRSDLVLHTLDARPHAPLSLLRALPVLAFFVPLLGAQWLPPVGSGLRAPPYRLVDESLFVQGGADLRLHTADPHADTPSLDGSREPPRLLVYVVGRSGGGVPVPFDHSISFQGARYVLHAYTVPLDGGAQTAAVVCTRRRLFRRARGQALVFVPEFSVFRAGRAPERVNETSVRVRDFAARRAQAVFYVHERYCAHGADSGPGVPLGADVAGAALGRGVEILWDLADTKQLDNGVELSEAYVAGHGLYDTVRFSRADVAGNAAAFLALRRDDFACLSREQYLAQHVEKMEMCAERAQSVLDAARERLGFDHASPRVHYLLRRALGPPPADESGEGDAYGAFREAFRGRDFTTSDVRCTQWPGAWVTRVRGDDGAPELANLGSEPYMEAGVHRGFPLWFVSAGCHRESLED